ncbi:DUF1816 domain-containing protein [Leptolyngbya cf. ectocarpi LEGE 11479]|uniref:DUF1816 domain-containing protein n=1 Tax=Leptolyngbya cf. ectocarpi LEGE 11479 TaxID=1828722 RepID=A0A928X3J7_LEPEC|nr:DUF1816 domain-containing protein [Leptolyngbya ectocarpi]MBE9067235.1 DUF1816 domain-containing protein [Leptolyngbya cf. ectocarpi LEGE 11479]
MNGLFSQLKGLFGSTWWIEVSTDTPRCIYYFGPFKHESEASQAAAGYVEDLEQEGAVLCQTSIMKRPTPKQLTVEYSSKFHASISAEPR